MPLILESIHYYLELKPTWINSRFAVRNYISFLKKNLLVQIENPPYGFIVNYFAGWSFGFLGVYLHCQMKFTDDGIQMKIFIILTKEYEILCCENWSVWSWDFRWGGFRHLESSFKKFQRDLRYGGRIWRMEWTREEVESLPLLLSLSPPPPLCT